MFSWVSFYGFTKSHRCSSFHQRSLSWFAAKASSPLSASVTRTHLFAGLRMCWVERMNEKQTTPARKRRPTADLLLERIRGYDSLQRLTRHRRSVRLFANRRT
jgi:hypothetical protein